MDGIEPRIESITGPMFCGKSEELIRRLRRHVVAGRYVTAFKPVIDNRYSIDNIVSHAEIKISAIPAYSTEDMRREIRNLKDAPDVVGIDEVQFFDENVVDFVYGLANRGKIVILSYLDQDYRGEPFKFKDSNKNVGDLLSISDSVAKLHAICVYQNADGRRCGKEATKTQRLTNGEPAHYGGSTIIVGTSKDLNRNKEQEVNTYEARCREHHIVPGRPS